MKKTSHLLIINDIISKNLYLSKSTSDGTGAYIWPRSALAEQKILTKLRDISDKVYYWKRENVPKRYHYSQNALIAPIIITAKHGLQVHLEHRWTSMGNHGYVNDDDDMNGFFIAFGPEFEKTIVLNSFFSENFLNFAKSSKKFDNFLNFHEFSKVIENLVLSYVLLIFLIFLECSRKFKKIFKI